MLLLIRILIFCTCFSVVAQDCSLEVYGTVSDHETEEGLGFVNIYVVGTDRGTVSDEHGHFHLDDMCPGEYHIVFSHIGCDPAQQFIDLKESSEVNVELEHSSKLLEGVVVTGHHVPNSTQNSQAISEQSISDHLDENLAELLDEISGVTTLRSGAGVSKPIVHGLYGNRLTLLNNGIAQSGQQWGNDHNPEIDPLIANRISVVKGVSALQYPGSNLGSVVLIEPARIKKEPHLHGSAGYTFSTNGRAHAANLQLYKSFGDLGWKVNGTLKKSGDKNTPDYFLTNSGGMEGNLSLQLEKTFTDRIKSSIYFSTFNQEQGVLRGSHIGNLTDLENAFQREVPFFTNDTFSYSINAPKQAVNHHLLKWANQWFFNNNTWIDFNTAVQYNSRREFDVRRSGRTDIPALSLQQWTFFSELKYNAEFTNNVSLNTGVQSNIIDNTNNPETGVFPLIPDYRSFEHGIYALLTKDIGNSLVEGGVRYEFIHQDVPTISGIAIPRIIRYKNNYHVIGASLGWKHQWNSMMQSSANLGISSRNPGINELYSGGLHQGVSGIEEGTTDLQAERALKATIAMQVNDDRRFAFDFLAYYQRIQDYIFLEPSGETRLTIRGAFPVFKYQQTDAEILGLDLSGQWKMSNSIRLKGTYSLIYGHDVRAEQPLIFIPPNNLRIAFNYSYAGTLSMGTKSMENIDAEITNVYVSRQKRYIDGQDFIAPPSGYNLLEASLSGEVQLSKYRLRIFLKGNNILNVRYRDYLNRQRYFADDLGVNVTMGARIKF